MAARTWYLYLLECADGTLYCGVTTDVERRVREHNGAGSARSARGAKYTRARRPVKLLHTERFRSRTNAQKREYAVKQLSRPEKLSLARS